MLVLKQNSNGMVLVALVLYSAKVFWRKPEWYPATFVYVLESPRRSQTLKKVRRVHLFSLLILHVSGFVCKASVTPRLSKWSLLMVLVQEGCGGCGALVAEDIIRFRSQRHSPSSNFKADVLVLILNMTRFLQEWMFKKQLFSGKRNFGSFKFKWLSSDLRRSCFSTVVH